MTCRMAGIWRSPDQRVRAGCWPVGRVERRLPESRATVSGFYSRNAINDSGATSRQRQRLL